MPAPNRLPGPCSPTGGSSVSERHRSRRARIASGWRSPLAGVSQATAARPSQAPDSGPWARPLPALRSTVVSTPFNRSPVVNPGGIRRATGDRVTSIEQGPQRQRPYPLRFSPPARHRAGPAELPRLAALRAHLCGALGRCGPRSSASRTWALDVPSRCAAALAGAARAARRPAGAGHGRELRCRSESRQQIVDSDLRVRPG